MANKYVYMNVPQANVTGGKTVCVPFMQEHRLVSARVVPTTAQSGSGSIKLGQAGASHWAMVASMDASTTAKQVVEASWNTDATTKEKKQVYGPDTPLEVNVSIATTTELGLEVVVDPYVSGARTSLG